MSGWHYRGRTVRVPGTADIPTPFRQRNSLGWIVQEVLDGMPEWTLGEDPIETMDGLEMPLSALVVPIGNNEVAWARHIGHRAQNVQLSPFVKVEAPKTRSFTIELEDTIVQPRLVRAYPGDYIPPLPWQRSAKNAYGGMRECRKFWSEHAYVYLAGRIVPGSETDAPPEWSKPKA